MLGKEGIRKGTAFAILNANYLMARLRPYYDIMYLKEREKYNHELIIDLTAMKKKTGVSEEVIQFFQGKTH